MRYRKKPVVIEAKQLGGDDQSLAGVVGWMMAHGSNPKVHGERTPFGLAIETLEGTMVASPGDFIIRGIQGEFYPCRPDIFWDTYEVAE